MLVLFFLPVSFLVSLFWLVLLLASLFSPACFFISLFLSMSFLPAFFLLWFFLSESFLIPFFFPELFLMLFFFREFFLRLLLLPASFLDARFFPVSFSARFLLLVSFLDLSFLPASFLDSSFLDSFSLFSCFLAAFFCSESFLGVLRLTVLIWAAVFSAMLFADLPDPFSLSALLLSPLPSIIWLWLDELSDLRVSFFPVQPVITDADITRARAKAIALLNLRLAINFMVGTSFRFVFQVLQIPLPSSIPGQGLRAAVRTARFPALPAAVNITRNIFLPFSRELSLMVGILLLNS